MLYREVGQFKTTYPADQALFPIRQDRVMVALWLAAAYVLVPLTASDYLCGAILVPFLVLSLAALGLNLLTGYCGQVSLGSGGFMAIGAYAAYNLCLRVPGMNPIAAILLSGFFATLVGVLVGIPSLRIKGFYLAVATLAAQFFIDWMFARVKWFTNYIPSGSLTAPPLTLFGHTIGTPQQKYLLCLVVVVVFAL